jgi:hypothetical protein
MIIGSAAQAACLSQRGTNSSMAVTTDLSAEPCLNCGDPQPGRFCRICGQKKGKVQVSIGRLLADALEDQLSINAALPRTLAALFLHPGRLTAEYTRGRIASYIAPFRLYLVSSLVFFLVLSVTSRVDFGDTGDFRPAPADSATVTDSARVRLSTQRGARFGVWVSPDSTGAIPANWADNVDINTGIERLDSVVARRLRQLGQLPPEEALNQVLSSALQRAPTVMFVLLPVFALLLKGLYFRSRRYYVEHFIFSLHYHSFAFLLFTVMLPLARTPIEPFLLLWMFLYLPIALRRVYAQGWIRTVLKWWALSFSYMLILVVGLVATLITGLVLL